MSGEKSSLIAVFNSDAQVVSMIRDVLDVAGYKVVTGLIPEYRNGDRRIQTFAAEYKPDLLIYGLGTDYKGEFDSLIRNILPFLPVLPVLVLVTIGAAYEMLEFDHGVSGMVIKPFQIRRLVQTVEEMLESHNQEVAA